ncbi:hypothetical protein PWT90_10740 [Aphanocladium album]|nr:hypothetical protein PWT90_10740 [Aphanocladium album]
MQLSQIALVIAAAATASATQVFAGERFADHKCGEPHSLPNRDFHVGECIELETVQGHQCSGKLVGDFQDFKGPGKVTPYYGYGACYDTSKGYWPKARSYMCIPEYPQN